jgi:FkbM family methyltransferase
MFRLLRGRPGVIIDVGAHTGTTLIDFANDDWVAYGFEPDPTNRGYLDALVAGMSNVTVDPRAVSEIDDDEVTLFTSDCSSGISSLVPFHVSHYAAATVSTVTLSTYMEEHFIQQVDFLKIDTEGYDLFVLRSFPWCRVTPQAVVCEFEDRKTVPLGYGFGDMARFLEDKGYDVFVSEWHPVIEYGLVHRWRRVRRWPMALADEKGWGNLIAVRPPLARRTLWLARRLGWQLRLRRLVQRGLRLIDSGERSVL